MLNRARFSAAFIIFLSSFSINANEPDRLPLPQGSGSHRYQLLTDINYNEVNGDHVADLRETMLVGYQLTEEDDGYKLTASPHYLTSKHSETRFITNAQVNSQNLFISDGMLLFLDKNHTPQSIVLSYEAEQASGSDTDPNDYLNWPDLIGIQLTRPSLAAGIELESGATLELPAEGVVPAMTISVVELEEETALLQVQGNEEESQLFGYLTVERESGWPVKSHFIINTVYTEEDGTPRGMRGVIALKPSDWPLGLRLGTFERFTPRQRHASGDFGDFQTPDEEDIFSADYGSFYSDFARFELEYEHPRGNIASMGRLVLSDLQAFNYRNEPTDMPLQALRQMHSQTGGGTDATSAFKVWPLGWRYNANSMRNVEVIEGTLSWYPLERHVFTLPLGEETVEIEHNGSRVVLMPEAEKGRYRLHFDGVEGTTLRADTDGIDTMKHVFPIDEAAPNWLSDTEKRFITANKHRAIPSNRIIDFEEGIDELHIELLAPAPEPRAQRRLPFYSHDGLQNSLAVPPDETVRLYQQPPSARDDTREFRASSLEELVPETFGRPQLYLTLTREQNALCEPIAPDTHINGRNLAWHRHATSSDPRARFSLQLSPNVNYLLTDSEQAQSAFYQREVQVGLQCEGEPEWRQTAFEPSERDWLVDLEQLLGENWQSLPLASQPLDVFLSHYRFIDEDGEPLAVDLPSTHASDLLITESPLSEFATETGILRILGHVHHVEQLHAAGEPFSLQWAHTFPPLPKYQDDLYPAEENRP